jgi:ATP-dependent protease HslVU (ClpYQ) peptidase subunit
MTFVAVLYADDYPLVVVDSLVSRADDSAPGVWTPLLATPDARSASGDKPVGLGRKFWLLPDRSIFSYAGTIGSARKLFDYLSECLSSTNRYDYEAHRNAVEFRQRRTPSNFSFLVITRAEENFDVYADGLVSREDIPSYGRVIAIGSGAAEGLKLLRQYSGVLPDSEDAMNGNALNVAARLTLDYKDDWGSGSKMSAASCGGYFEVVPPLLYEKSYEFLYRNTAHVFLSGDREGITLSRFIVANQRDTETVVLVANGLSVPVNDSGFSIDCAHLRKYTICENRLDTDLHVPFDGQLSFGNITFLVIYASGIPECGLPEHAFRTQSLSLRGGQPVALLFEDDSPDMIDSADDIGAGPGRLVFEIMLGRHPSPLGRMCDWMYAAMICQRCVTGAS